MHSSRSSWTIQPAALSKALIFRRVETWRHYNESRPHTALGLRPPQQFALAGARQAAE